MSEKSEGQFSGSDVDPVTGNFVTKENSSENNVQPVLDRETLKNFQTLEMSIETNLQPVLEELNTKLGLNMAPRPDGYHLTIVSPPESGTLSKLSDEQIQQLQKISSDIQNGVGVDIKGVGFIDGSTANVREADKDKKVAFLALDIPALQAFRESVGLPKKDFHVTLGFEGGDMHMQVAGLNEKGKPILKPISKQASSEFDDNWNSFKSQEKIEFSGLSGQER